MYKILFKNYYNYFYKLKIILSVSNNFKDGFINFIIIIACKSQRIMQWFVRHKNLIGDMDVKFVYTFAISSNIGIRNLYHD